MDIFCFTTRSYDETSWSLSYWFLDWWRWPQSLCSMPRGIL